MSVHPAAQRGFGRAADSYERARPDYPHEAVDWLVGQMRLGPSTVVVDLGAGTGNLTRLLVRTGARVIAVEPVPEMRAKLAGRVRSIKVLDGTAEAIPLDDGSANGVTAGQAFHWFRSDQALAEMHRVLRSGGSLGLIWNLRDVSQPLQAALDAIVSPHQRHEPRERWRAALDETPFFTRWERRQFRWEVEWVAERLVAFASSLSEIAALADDDRSAALGQVLALTSGLPACFPVRFRTDAYVCWRRGARELGALC